MPISPILSITQIALYGLQNAEVLRAIVRVHPPDMELDGTSLNAELEYFVVPHVEASPLAQTSSQLDEPTRRCGA